MENKAPKTATLLYKLNNGKRMPPVIDGHFEFRFSDTIAYTDSFTPTKDITFAFSVEMLQDLGKQSKISEYYEMLAEKLKQDFLGFINTYEPIDIKPKPSEHIYGLDYNIAYFDMQSAPVLKMLHTEYPHATPTFETEQRAWNWIEENKEDIRIALLGLSPQMVVIKSKYI